MTFLTFLKLLCPVCEKGKLFRGYFDSPARCPNCGYFFMRETGYFLPHVPIGYGFTVLIALGTWPLLRFVFGVQSPSVTLFVIVSTAFLFGIWFIRYSKMLWLALDLRMHPPVTEDFKPRGRKEA